MGDTGCGLYSRFVSTPVSEVGLVLSLQLPRGETGVLRHSSLDACLHRSLKVGLVLSLQLPRGGTGFLRHSYLDEGCPSSFPDSSPQLLRVVTK